MNPSFFGLEGHPFEPATEEGDAFLSDAHGALTAELHAGLKAPHGITLLIGDEGSGKTTLARCFAAELADTATVAYLPTTGPGLRHLLTEIIEQLGGADSSGTEEQALLDELTRLARARAEHDRLTLLILDDAHELPAKTIERLGKLFGDDPAEPSMLHIILVGRGELLDRMNAANDRSILKHLVQVCRMDPIGPEESFRYIADRISKVGGVVDSLFTEDALHLIVRRANGFPARLDAICTASLDYAEGRGDASVDMEAVDSACTGVKGFAIDQGAGATAGYFPADDENEQSEPEIARIEEEVLKTDPGEDMEHRRASVARTSAAQAVGAAEPGGRRRLVFWAVGLIGVVGLFAATMSGTDGTGAGDDLSGIGGGGAAEQIAALVPEDKVRSKQAIDAEPVAAPKLSLSKPTGDNAANARPGTAATAAAKRQQILNDLQQNATPRRATVPVHASPRNNEGTVGGDAPAVARPRVQSPRYAPSPKVQPAEVAPTSAPSTRTASAVPATAKTTSPTPATPIVAAPTAAENPTPVPTRVAAAPAPAKVAPTLPRKYYTVQLGAFGNRENAEALLAKVRVKYSDGHILASADSGKSVFRVVSGTFVNVEDAKGRATVLEVSGYKTYVRSFGE
jgi:type II secretory pathway predicted ATPase ExeA/cell division protein FtsN